jgi:putative NADH-flavin reductase
MSLERSWDASSVRKESIGRLIGQSWLKALAAGLCLFLSGASAESLDISVIGGAGTIGQRIVQEALQRGHRVTIIVRDPARVDQRHERQTVSQGDVLDAARIAMLVDGQDVVVSAVGSARAKSPDPSLYRRAAESLVTALRTLGESAPRLIVVGGAGSLQDASGKLLVDRLPEKRKPESLGQKAALDYYRTIDDVQWTYVSPAAHIAPGKRTGVFRRGGDQLIVDDKGESRISMEDYAVALIDEAENPQYIRKRFTVGY